VLCIGLLMPFDFSLSRFGFTRLEATNGVEFSAPGAVLSTSLPERFFESLVSGTGLTVDLWLEARRNQEVEVARIVSYSGGSGANLNLTVAQRGQGLVVSLRTEDGLPDSFSFVQGVFATEGRRHVVLSYEPREARVYVDGEVRKVVTGSFGGLSNWDASYWLVLGNVGGGAGDKSWLGRLFKVAIYSRALSEREVEANLAAGPWWSSEGSSARPVQAGLVALYPFAEGEGDQVFDRSGNLPPADLHRPTGSEVPTRYSLLSWPRWELEGRAMDVLLNFAIFVPFGLMTHRLLDRRGWPGARSVALVTLLGVGFSLAAETLQSFSAVRISAIDDVVLNACGTALGATLAMVHRKHGPDPSRSEG